jgi:hypothetical protein
MTEYRGIKLAAAPRARPLEWIGPAPQPKGDILLLICFRRARMKYLMQTTVAAWK